ncbi:hypothetical protein [Psychrobacter sp. LV10R520-6]
MTISMDQSTSDFDQQHLWHPYASLPPTYPNIVIDHAMAFTLSPKMARAL